MAKMTKQEKEHLFRERQRASLEQKTIPELLDMVERRMARQTALGRAYWEEMVNNARTSTIRRTQQQVLVTILNDPRSSREGFKKYVSGNLPMDTYRDPKKRDLSAKFLQAIESLHQIDQSGYLARKEGSKWRLEYHERAWDYLRKIRENTPLTDQEMKEVVNLAELLSKKENQYTTTRRR